MPKMRGAIPSPRHKLQRAHPFTMPKTVPDQFAIVPPQLSMWGNQQFGDCVSAEEAYAKACYALMCNLPETFIPEQEVIRWARSHGYLNGANLTEVMESMAGDGMVAKDGKKYTDGGYAGVDFSDEKLLRAAICVGPVKLGIAADSLPGSAGDENGWYAITKHPSNNEDHCTGLSGFGTAEFLYQALGVARPAAVPATLQGYLFFTWSTIGFVTHEWLMGATGEAWVRFPTTPGQEPGPTPPTPPIPPIPPGPGPSIWDDVMKLIADVAAKNWLAVFADVVKLWSDLFGNVSKPELEAGFKWLDLIREIVQIILSLMSRDTHGATAKANDLKRFFKTA